MSRRQRDKDRTYKMKSKKDASRDKYFLRGRDARVDYLDKDTFSSDSEPETTAI